MPRGRDSEGLGRGGGLERRYYLGGKGEWGSSEVERGRGSGRVEGVKGERKKGC